MFCDCLKPRLFKMIIKHAHDLQHMVVYLPGSPGSPLAQRMFTCLITAFVYSTVVVSSNQDMRWHGVIWHDTMWHCIIWYDLFCCKVYIVYGIWRMICNVQNIVHTTHMVLKYDTRYMVLTYDILRRYESLTHFRPLGVKSVCGGCLACGLSAGSWRVGSPFPLRHLSCLSAAHVHERGSEEIKISSHE